MPYEAARGARWTGSKRPSHARTKRSGIVPRGGAGERSLHLPARIVPSAQFSARICMNPRQAQLPPYAPIGAGAGAAGRGDGRLSRDQVRRHRRWMPSTGPSGSTAVPFVESSHLAGRANAALLRCICTPSHLHVVDIRTTEHLPHGSVLHERSETPAPVGADWRVLVPRSGLHRAQTIVREATGKKPVFPSGIEKNYDVLQFNGQVPRPPLANTHFSRAQPTSAALAWTRPADLVDDGSRVRKHTARCVLHMPRYPVAGGAMRHRAEGHQ